MAPQPGLDLPGAPTLLQLEGEKVVVATEADQEPLADVEPVPGEPQRVGAVAEVSTDGEVTLADLGGQTESGRGGERRRVIG